MIPVKCHTTVICDVKMNQVWMESTVICVCLCLHSESVIHLTYLIQ